MLFTVLDGPRRGRVVPGHRAGRGGRRRRRARPRPRRRPAARRAQRARSSATAARCSPRSTRRRRGWSWSARSTPARRCAARRAGLGWRTIVVDARAAFATPERMPSADELVVRWPAEALAEIAPDHQTAVVVLSHDEKFDVPALLAALRTEAFYIGAIGARRTQERRRARLLEEGADPAALERISGPVRPGRRRGHAGRDGRLDPGRGARRARRAQRRAAAGREGDRSTRGAGRRPPRRRPEARNPARGRAASVTFAAGSR